MIYLRSLFGGLLMGIANIVPGISGGAMLLIVGVYHRFLEALAAMPRFDFKLRHILMLASVAFGAGLTILFLAGIVRDLIVGYRWQSYSIVAGMRLAIIPIVWALAVKAGGARSKSLWVGAVVGLILTAVAAGFTYSTATASTSSSNQTLMAFLGGLLGASATILPGMDGSYILMLLDQYVVILGAIDQFKEGLLARDWAGMSAALPILIPTGIGVCIGLFGVASVMKWALARYPHVTYGVLLGILAGAMVGLYPFAKYRQPVLGDVVAGQTVTEANLSKMMQEKEKWPLDFFAPTGAQVGGAIGLLLLGIAAGWAIAKLERATEQEEDKPLPGKQPPPAGSA